MTLNIRQKIYNFVMNNNWYAKRDIDRIYSNAVKA